VLKELHAVLSGHSPIEGLGERMGNESLDTGREQCTPVHSRPLPLVEILESIYRRLDAELPGG
jgi:hypothetical protein